MNWPQVSSPVPEAFTLAPSPVSFKGLDPNKTSNQKFSLFQFSGTHTQQKQKREEGLLFNSMLSFTRLIKAQF
jgi:hypothetical protein